MNDKLMRIESFQYQDRLYRNCFVTDLEAAGLPAPAIAEAVTAARHSVTKREARERIYAIASAEAQMAMAAAAAVISAKSVATRSKEEKATLEGVEAFGSWTQAMRTAARDIAEGKDGAEWPDCPDAAQATADQF